MKLLKILNLIGLGMVTLGALGAMSAPAPTYNPDGSISLGPRRHPNETEDQARKRRIRKAHFQRIGLPTCFALIAVGSALQAYTVWAAD